MSFGPGPRKGSDSERFWAKVDKRGPDECWLWLGAPCNNGYGRISLGSRKDGTERVSTAHRFVCEMTHGLPKDLQALHHCDNKLCVNPAHIYPGTHLDNTRDAVERGLRRGGSSPGTRNAKAKITESDVIAIRKSAKINSHLASDYGLSKTQIGHIRSGKSWGHVSVD